MWLRGVRLLDFTLPLGPLGRFGSDFSAYEYPVVDLHIHHGRIAQIAPASKWNGTWVMPGLWDRHVHMSEWGGPSTGWNLVPPLPRPRPSRRVRGGPRPGTRSPPPATWAGSGPGPPAWPPPS